MILEKSSQSQSRRKPLKSQTSQNQGNFKLPILFENVPRASFAARVKDGLKAFALNGPPVSQPQISMQPELKSGLSPMIGAGAAQEDLYYLPIKGIKFEPRPARGRNESSKNSNAERRLDISGGQANEPLHRTAIPSTLPVTKSETPMLSGLSTDGAFIITSMKGEHKQKRTGSHQETGQLARDVTPPNFFPARRRATSKPKELPREKTTDFLREKLPSQPDQLGSERKEWEGRETPKGKAATSMNQSINQGLSTPATRDTQLNVDEIQPFTFLRPDERIKLDNYFRARMASLVGLLVDFIEKKRKGLPSLQTAKPSKTPAGPQQVNVTKAPDSLVEECFGLLVKVVSMHSKFKHRDRFDFLGFYAKRIQQELALCAVGSKLAGNNGRKAFSGLEPTAEHRKEDEEEDYEEDDSENESEGDDDEDEKPKPKAKVSQTAKKKKKKEMKEDIPQQPLVSPFHTDKAAWKRKHQVDPDAKIFIIIGALPDLRHALLERGWVENDVKDSLIFDLKWSLKAKDIPHDQLTEEQFANHFAENASIVSKLGLCRNIRNLVWSHDIDVDLFLPRNYDINDRKDFNDFLEEFKRTEAECLIRRFTQRKSAEKGTLTSEELVRLRTALSILKRRLASLEVTITELTRTPPASPIVTLDEWKALLTGQRVGEDEDSRKSYQTSEELYKESVEVLTAYQSRSPQSSINGIENVWILKPANLSRGRGVSCYNNILDILGNCQRSTDLSWVAQKYIENPLIIWHRKFDIRQWVVVTDWNPLTVWFYEECYIRFGAEEYNPNNFGNKFAHLTNNSIAKYSEQFDQKIEGNMWDQQQFREHLQSISGRDAFSEDIQPKMKQYVIWSLLCVTDMVKSKKRSFELYGYDFLVDTNFKPWLLEVNSSPAMEYSTKVTARLVSMVLRDVVKVVVDYGLAKGKAKKSTDTGLFKMIYKGKPT